MLVIEYKVVGYDYFMDEMKLYELFDVLQLVPWANSVSNNQMRYIVWAALKPYLKKKSITPAELMPLPSDNESMFVKSESQKDEYSPLDENEIIQIRETILNNLKEEKTKI